MECITIIVLVLILLYDTHRAGEALANRNWQDLDFYLLSILLFGMDLYLFINY
jgi:hypothetical protein